MEATATEDRCSYKWWIIWALSFLGSLLPPIVFHWKSVADIIEPLRFAGMLLPSHLLMFRWLGELSHWMPVILLAVAFLARRMPEKAKGIIYLGASLTGIFSAVYAAYSILIASIYIDGYVEAMRETQQAEEEASFPPQGFLWKPQAKEHLNILLESTLCNWKGFFGLRLDRGETGKGVSNSLP